MATLADILRQTGYAQDGTLATPTLTESPMTKALADHIASIPQKFQENAINTNNMVQNAMPYDFATHSFQQGPTYEEFLNYMPNMVGMTASYKGSHVAPNAKEYGAYFHALDELIPKDVYSSQGKRLYGIGDTLIDHDWYMAALKSKGKPDNLVEVHRAVPKGITDLNNGDWVTPSKKYAEWHGENALNGEYDILTKKVKAKELSTEGYPYELGYNPE